MLEIDDVILTPGDVCQAGHVDGFTDWIRKDHKKDECLIANDLVRWKKQTVISSTEGNTGPAAVGKSSLLKPKRERLLQIFNPKYRSKVFYSLSSHSILQRPSPSRLRL